MTVGDTWYAQRLGVTLVAGSGRRQALRLRRAAGQDELIVTHARASGTVGLLLLEALTARRRGHRRVVLLEFIRSSSSGWRRLWDRFLGALLRAGVLHVHVLTAAEIERYERRYALPAGTAVFVPWPLEAPADELPTRLSDGARSGVVASGRAACDWATFFAAAKIGGWPSVTVICGAPERAQVDALNDVGATVLTDIPADEHAARVAGAEVYVLPLREDAISSGHIRLMTAIGTRTPVVAAAVDGLDGYAIPEVSAATYVPGDASALAAAVSRLLTGPDEARALAARATEFAAGKSYEHYFEQLRSGLLGRSREEAPV